MMAKRSFESAIARIFPHSGLHLIDFRFFLILRVNGSMSSRRYNRTLPWDAVASQPEEERAVAMSGMGFRNRRCLSSRFSDSEPFEAETVRKLSMIIELGCEALVLSCMEDIVGYMFSCLGVIRVRKAEKGRQKIGTAEETHENSTVA